MAENSLNLSMDSAKKHYRSMFFLPSLKTAFLAIAITCLVGANLCAYAIFPSFNSLLLGPSFFAISVLASLLVSQEFLKHDPIFTKRRTLIVSLAGWLIWLFFLALGTGLGLIYGNLVWVKLSFLGFASVVTLRFIVFLAISTAAKWRLMFSVLLEPALCITALLTFLATVSTEVAWQVVVFPVAAIMVALIAVYLLLSSVDHLGQSVYGLPAMSLFRAFLLNWVADQNAPLEKYLEAMGQDADIEVSLLKFDSEKPKAALIVPLVHPGPFKNIGSSLLPSLLKSGYQSEFGGDACVPLGILGHELDLASQNQNQKILKEVISHSKLTDTSELASSLVKAKEGYATVCCQIFGEIALVSFSLAPKTTEDLPQELGRAVTEEAKRLGLKSAVLVNAHNSLTDVVDTDEHVESLRKAAFDCLQKAVSRPKQPFKVGAATVIPSEFSLKDGMGTGGITAIAVQAESQKVVYIVIDGNNMVSGLREKLLYDLGRFGFDESEVFTTDTHAVSARVTGKQGYHPVGEAMDYDLLVGYVSQSARNAVANMECCFSSFSQFVVPRIRVIGEDRLKAITTLVDKSIDKLKRIVIPIFGVEGLVLLMLLLLL